MRFDKATIDRIDRRKDKFSSGAFVEDLKAHWSILDIGLRDVCKKLSRKEAQLILDVQNGIYWHGGDVDTWLNGGLLHQVSDGIALDALDEKWEIDASSLIWKIESMDRIEILALIDWCMVWWNNRDDEEFIQREFRRFKQQPKNEKQRPT